jgi:predicted ATPase
MIRSLTISGFKRFESQTFGFAPLTVLAGLNGTGKTSLIHALLLARAASARGNEDTVRLNGPFGMELGTAADVRNWSADDSISIDVQDSGGGGPWKFHVPADDVLYLNVSGVPTRPSFAFADAPRAFTYLCAERLGPRDVLGSAALPPKSIEVGVRGEYTAQVLAVLGGRRLEDENRLHPTRPDGASPLLKYEVERWLAEIARPVELESMVFSGTAVTAMKFRVPGGDWVRAPNMGFGVTYSLPVVLAGLMAAKGGLLIVENPEAHLHPAGQSRMGVFLAWLASKGVQVLVETHSDHVLNGIRRAIGEHRYLGADDALVQFFDTAEGDKPRVTELRFTASGGVSAWPAGFFDQYQVDVAALGRVRRQR